MKKLLLFSIVSLFAVFVFSSISIAQKVDFSGIWKMNQGKSDLEMLNPTGADISVTMTIEQKEQKFKVKTVIDTPMGVEEESGTYTLDGKESKNIDQQGVEMVTVCKWRDKTLVCDSKGETANGTMTVKEEYTLSEDKKVLTLILIINSPMGEVKATIVLDKV